ncbi:unnamed protein product, partial [marine sediment metagenome]
EWVLSHDDAYLRSHSKEKKLIREHLKKPGKTFLIEEVAYTWFNRIAALRFMDNRHYNTIKIVSPAKGATQPELLSVLKRGEIPKHLAGVKQEIEDLLNGRIQTKQPDREVFKIALLTYCNHMGAVMPFLFKKIDDWAALLLPVDLLSSESIISDFQTTITEE